MKVILQKDVKGVGHAHDTIDASDGYALNFLIPKRLAVPATEGAQKEAEFRQRQVHERKTLDAKLLAQNLAALAEARIVIRTKANEKGHLYDTIGAADLSAAVKTQAHVDLPEEAVRLEKPIKQLGTFEVPVSAGETFGKFTIIIESET